jgi:hypothetical protein
LIFYLCSQLSTYQNIHNEFMQRNAQISPHLSNCFVMSRSILYAEFCLNNNCVQAIIVRFLFGKCCYCMQLNRFTKNKNDHHYSFSGYIFEIWLQLEYNDKKKQEMNGTETSCNFRILSDQSWNPW